MLQLDQKLKASLSAFAQRSLKDGELVLLAKAIADSIPLAEAGTDSMTQYTISHNNLIYWVVSEINEYSYLDEDKVTKLKKLITDFSTWRHRVAYNPPGLIFQGKTDTVIDDVSALGRYVDTQCLCSIADVAEQATHLYSTFKELVVQVQVKLVSA